MAKKTVPKKNVAPVFLDIRRPRFILTAALKRREVNLRFAPRVIYRHHRLTPTRIFLGLVAFAVVVGALVFYSSLLTSKRVFADASVEMNKNFSAAVAAFSNLDFKNASQILKENGTLITKTQNEFRSNPAVFLTGSLGNVVPVVGKIGILFAAAGRFNDDLSNLATNLSGLESNGFHYLLSDGHALLDSLSAMQTLMKTTADDAETIKNTAADLRDTAEVFKTLDDEISGAYVKHSIELRSAEAFLRSVIALLGTGDEKHFLVFFQNPAEIRPGGGFIGSYADCTFANGQIQNIAVNDIYYPDLRFPRKIVPPRELQTLTETWGARDANWFFDFPTSAKTVMNFLETSNVYKDKGVGFEGAIAVNINVLESVLELTGPVPLADYNLTIDKNNFLEEIQREVEAGEDKAAGHPKKILQTLAPLLIEKFENLGAQEKKEFVGKLTAHLAAKDIMVFARDGTITEFLSAKNLDGSVYDLPNNFWGTYLAVVNANVAGGKSDVFVNQTVTGEIDLDTGGGSFVDLKIMRAHAGDKEKDPWWRATNQDFIQVYANPDAQLVDIKGNDVKKVVSNFDYNSSGYERNADLDAIESTKTLLQGLSTWTMKAFGKNVFATWLMTPAGSVKTLEVRYQIPQRPSVTLDSSSTYQFIFEKQSGVPTSLGLDIVAPFGYHWRESGSVTYRLENPNSEKRVLLDLTLEKNSGA